MLRSLRLFLLAAFLYTPAAVALDVDNPPMGVFSDEWYAPFPGTDAAIALAMAHVIMNEGLADEQFIRAMREGVSPEGDPYYPAFPYLSYQRMKVEDVLDLKAFLSQVL